jgi:hypothetical protein
LIALRKRIEFEFAAKPLAEVSAANFRTLEAERIFAGLEAASNPCARKCDKPLNRRCPNATYFVKGVIKNAKCCDAILFK